MADPTTGGSAPSGIDAERVSGFLQEHVPGAVGPFAFELLSGGRSNVTCLVRCSDDSTFVLRRPPLGHVLPTAHDMSREYRVLDALADTAVPVPRPLALCEDPEVTGAPFYVMEYRPGVVVEGRMPAGFADREEERRRLSQALVDTLVALHEVDIDAVGLGGFGRPDGYLERQVRRWSEQWERSKTEETPIIDELIRRLRASLPASPAPTVVHGDYRLGNMALDPDDPGRVVAVFDWEMATLGDPLADLGYTLIYWSDPEETEGPPGVASVAPVTNKPGFLTRDEIALCYARRSGRDVSAIDFYRVLALSKLAVIAEGIWARHVQGKTLGRQFEGMTRRTDEIAERALALADASSDASLRGQSGR